MKDGSFQEALDYIAAIPRFTEKRPLSDTALALEKLGHPEDTFRVVHVAGSNGKGSVCTMIHEGLLLSGETAALFTSPHLVDIRERFVVGREQVSPEGFVRAYRRVRALSEEMEGEGKVHPSWFEFLFLMGCLLFAEAGVPWVVLETGLGGRLDATNAVRRPSLTVLTSISLEHRQYLGDTVPEIAAEKAGILKEGVPVVFDASDPAASEVILKKAREKGAQSYPVFPSEIRLSSGTGEGIQIAYRPPEGEEIALHIPVKAPYQGTNAALAVRSLRLLGVSDPVCREAVARFGMPGRMQELSENFYVDGAHNPAGIRAFVEAVRLFGGKAPVLVFAMMKDKDWEEAVSLLRSVEWERVYATQVKDPRTVPAERLAEAFGGKAVAETDLSRVLSAAREQAARGHKVFCAGSLYLAGEIMDDRS